MNYMLLWLFDLTGTIAFAISGAFIGIRKRMDLFGVIVLGITTACGGGLIRDLIIGHTPPAMFRNPFFVGVAALVSLTVFILAYKNQHVPSDYTGIYDKMLFWFDTLGLAAFTVDGVVMGVNAGFGDNPFLLIFLGFLTGVGGGALRDILADQMPDIFRKHIYAVASIAGGCMITMLYTAFQSRKIAMFGGFLLILLLRCLAAHYHWNLPRIERPNE